eukprot:UN23714
MNEEQMVNMMKNFEEKHEEVNSKDKVTMADLMKEYENDDDNKSNLINQVLPMPADGEQFDESDSDDVEITESDEVCVLCKIADEVAMCELCVFDTESYNLFTHHDMCLGEISTAICFVNQDPHKKDSKTPSFVAVGHMNAEITLWDLTIQNPPGPSITFGGLDEKSGKYRKGSHTDSILCIAWNPHSKVLATGSSDTTIKLWTLDKSLPVATIDTKESTINSLMWHPREINLLLAGGTQNETRLINTKNIGTKQDTEMIFNTKHDGECAAWNPLNPALFLVGTEEGEIRCFDVRKKDKTKPLWVQNAAKSSISQLCFVVENLIF